MKKEQSLPQKDLTENGAETYINTGEYVLDLFSMGGAVRSRPESEVIEMFKKAYSENALLAMRTMFYLRDVRGGQGERNTFRILWKWLCNTDKKVAMKNLENVPFFGRWDDLIQASIGTPMENAVFSMVGKQFTKDTLQEDDTKLSLLAKWLPSPNTSSEKTRNLARKIYKYLEMSEKEYRKSLSKLRTRLNVVEKLMAKNKWSRIDYSAVPSRASSIYKNAFKKHDGLRYSTWQDKAVSGEVKVNSGALYPYDIVRDLRRNPHNKTLEAQWNQLPDYLADNNTNLLVMADVSGSMTCGTGSVTPIDVCISLAIYIAERNSGKFKDHFLTFSTNSTLQQLVGDSLTAKIRNLNSAEWDMSTNLQSAFDAVLTTATKYRLPKSEMPSSIIIISDMEFDYACGYRTNLEEIRKKYAFAGYSVPNIIFWNVNSRNNNVAAKKNDQGVMLVSGCSPSILQQVLSAGSKTPHTLMMEVINSERYQRVVV
jgi:hypothetical protein